jgi:hypothetical protein
MLAACPACRISLDLIILINIFSKSTNHEAPHYVAFSSNNFIHFAVYVKEIENSVFFLSSYIFPSLLEQIVMLLLVCAAVTHVLLKPACEVFTQRE